MHTYTNMLYLCNTWYGSGSVFNSCRGSSQWGQLQQQPLSIFLLNHWFFKFSFSSFQISWEDAVWDIRMQSNDNRSVHPFLRAHGTALHSFSPQQASLSCRENEALFSFYGKNEAQRIKQKFCDRTKM